MYETPGLGRQIAKGAGWTVMMRLSVLGIGTISTLILARLLTPADFGLVTLATAFSAGLAAISEFSFDVVLIQNQSAGRSYYDTAWTLQVLRNVILAACLGFAAMPIAVFFEDPRIETVVYCLAGITLLDGFQNIGTVDFRKHLLFHKDFVFMVVAKIAMFVVAVPLAYSLRNYWALVAGIASGAVARLVLSYSLHRYRPRVSLIKWRNIMRFSKWLLANNGINFGKDRADTFVIGKLVGAHAVGIYSVASEIALLTMSALMAPLRRAVFPGFAQVSHNPESLRKTFYDVLSLVILLSTPVAVGIGLVAAPLVHVALGEQWLEAIPLIRVLTIYGFLSILETGTSPVYLATARPHFVTWLMGGNVLILIPALIFGVHYAGLLGVAWALTLAAALTAVVDLVVVVRLLKLRVPRIIGVVWRPLVATALMGFAVVELQAYWPNPESVVHWGAILLAAIALGAVVYPFVVAVLWFASGQPDGAERHVLVAIRQLLLRFRNRGAGGGARDKGSVRWTESGGSTSS